MSMPTPRTIIDVTQLVHWPGMLAGIPRVMNELGTRFYSQKDREVVFVTWVKDLRCYCEIDFAKTMANRGTQIAYIKKGEPSPSREAKMLSATLAIKSGAKAEPGKAPSQPLFKRAARIGIAGVRRVSGRAATLVESRAKQLNMATYKRINFEKGDKVFIPWVFGY